MVFFLVNLDFICYSKSNIDKKVRLCNVLKIQMKNWEKLVTKLLKTTTNEGNKQVVNKFMFVFR